MSKKFDPFSYTNSLHPNGKENNKKDMPLRTPSFYDPYNNISFVELNKNRRREYGERSPSERIYNQVYRPRTIKIFIRRNGDRETKPKQFIWRVWQSQKLEDLIEEAGNHLNMAEPEILYDTQGHQITDPDQVMEGALYVVANHRESFDSRPHDTPYSTTHTRHTKAPVHHTKHPQHHSPKRKPSLAYRSRTPSPSTHRYYREQDDAYSVNPVPYEPPPISTPGRTERPYSDYGQYNHHRSSQNEDYYSQDHRYHSNHHQPSRHAYSDQTPNQTDIEIIDEWGIADLDEMHHRDREMLHKHKTKHAGRRTRSAIIYNRKDQTNPDAYLIYAFLNGNGLECQYISFTRRQLEKGIKYILELVAKKFNVNPSKLVNMDGVRVKEVNELMSRGAYVLVPVGQTFRDTWYFLPDNAIDTSNDLEKVRNRSAQRDRYLQKQQKKVETKRKMDMIKQQNSRGRSVAQQYSNGRYRSKSVEPYLR